LQDRQGFLWFGTGDGLNKYDGYRITTYKYDPADTNSLSHNWVWPLHEDREGILWIGTQSGLNRFDPKTAIFTHYRHDPDDPNSLSQNQIRVIYEDRKGVLWIGVHGRQGGLHRFDRTTETFTRYQHDRDDPTSLSNNDVVCIYEDRAGQLWIGTGIGGGGLDRFDPETESFTHYSHDPGNPKSLSNDVIPAIHEDRDGFLWLATFGGLNRFDPTTETFTHYQHNPDDPTSLSSDLVRTIYADHTGTLWLGTGGGGLNRFDPDTEIFTHYRHDPNDPTSLSNDFIFTLYGDHSGVLWIGTRGGGLSFVDLEAKPFMHYRHDPTRSPSLSSDFIHAIYEDRSSVLWIGTRENGLDRLDRRAHTLTQYQHDPDDPHSLSHNTVNALYEDHTGVLWISTWGGGLNRFEPRTETFAHYRYDPDTPASLSSDYVETVYEDRSGVLWVGTGGGGLNQFDRETGIFTYYLPNPDAPQSLSDNSVRAIYEDRAGRLWIGTWNGLNRFDRETKTFTRYPYNPDDPGSLSVNGITAIYERRHEPGILWIGTASGGLNRFDTHTGRFIRLTEQNSELPSNTVWGVLGDDQGRLWLSTHRGLARYDPDTNTFRRYGEEDGLQSKEFNVGAYHKGRSGEFFFGGVNGLNAFFPDRIRDNPHPPQVILTDFKLFNRSVKVGPKAPLRAPLSETESITLSHKQRDLTFDFVALHYSHPEKNQYAYMLGPYDEDWHYVGTQRTATYTNLSPGTYVFRVKAANSDGVWNEGGASVHITIQQPWWQTWWASLLWTAGLALVLFAGYRLRVQRLRAHARTLRREVAERTRDLVAEKQKTEEQARRLAELDAAKDRFFANLSHEFRTPLTLITGPLQDALAGKYTAEALRRQHRLMLRQAQQLLHLVNQLLDLTKLEAGQMALHQEPGDLAAFLHQLVCGFAPLAEHGRITLQFRSERKAQPAYFDPEVLSTVSSNLLSNALKFTPEGGKVWVVLQETTVDNGTFIEITVKDTGPGIPREDLARIFNRFEQVDGSTTRVHEGTGIGLALARELIELHGGKILVESEVGFGSAFIVRLPLEEPGQDEPTRQTRGGAVSPDLAVFLQDSSDGSSKAEPVVAETASAAPTVLIVEDNADVRAFLRSHLEPGYRVVEAADGEAGLAQAQAHRPDLILSDVMMPRMDGYALCRALKADETLRAIPVVLLTARANEQDTVLGLETGADEYLTKPFSASELRARVANLIATRQQLRMQFSREVRVEPAGIAVASEEAAFLERILAVIEDHLGDSTFNVEMLAAEMGLSSRQLTRRVRAVTGEAPGRLIRRLRLERATYLLEAHVSTIAEVAYAVGFQDADHFSKQFRRVYGVPPSRYTVDET
ncbi:MAG TPA: two-component regulator propeller domain-containing protein, partial [Rhodothermales bacterium]|nr:two-component regulator propeller domain-containing protein [Rhodothermales bacterium]